MSGRLRDPLPCDPLCRPGRASLCSEELVVPRTRMCLWSRICSHETPFTF